MGWQSKGGDDSQEMTGTGQAMEQTETGGSMDMPAVVVLPPQMQVEVLMGGSVVVMTMGMAVELKTEGGANGEGTNDEERHPNKEFSPGGHGLHMGEILESNGEESESDNTGGMPCSPGQCTAQSLEGPVDGEGSHRHEVISTGDDMNGTGCKSSQNADQHQLMESETEFCRSGTSWILTRPHRFAGAGEHFLIYLGKIAHDRVEHWLQMVVTANQKPIQWLY